MSREAQLTINDAKQMTIKWQRSQMTCFQQQRKTKQSYSAPFL
jgi:hypothetical protein